VYEASSDSINTSEAAEASREIIRLITYYPNEAVRWVNCFAVRKIHCCVMLRNRLWYQKHRALRWRFKFVVKFSVVGARA
jgi:hypothetical protein